MKILKTRNELIQWRKEEKDLIGYVPTMGALHAGHLSLIKKSISENNKTIVSIFVNPTQFEVNEDFNKYPRNIENDINLCNECKVDAVFIPSIEEMYHNKNETIITPPKHLNNVFEGAIRPNHFSGVLIIIMKFFSLIKPNNAYFGKKDAQQLLIIKKMVNDLFLDINIIGCPIVRDSNNLALSSRNIYLSKENYNKALKIPQTINLITNAIKNGEIESNKLENLALNNLNNFEVNYCKVVNFDLKNVKYIKSKNTLIIISVKIDNVRLLDNVWIQDIL